MEKTMNLRTLRLKTALIMTIPAIALVIATWSANGIQAAGSAVQDAKATFNSKCASCHGLDGGAATAKGKELKMKDLRSPEVQGMSDDQLYKVIASGKGKMPPYEKSLGADTCHKLVAYIRSMKK
jgi:mono/diheme cytochrome c family protein